MVNIGHASYFSSIKSLSSLDPKAKEVQHTRCSESSWECSDSTKCTPGIIRRELICKSEINLRITSLWPGSSSLLKEILRHPRLAGNEKLLSFLVNTLDRHSAVSWQFCCKQQILKKRNVVKRKAPCRGPPAMPEWRVLNFRGFFKTGMGGRLGCTDSSC